MKTPGKRARSLRCTPFHSAKGLARGFACSRLSRISGDTVRPEAPILHVTGFRLRMSALAGALNLIFR
jgi:hypothetical protein